MAFQIFYSTDGCEGSFEKLYCGDSPSDFQSTLIHLTNGQIHEVVEVQASYSELRCVLAVCEGIPRPSKIYLDKMDESEDIYPISWYGDTAKFIAMTWLQEMARL